MMVKNIPRSIDYRVYVVGGGFQYIQMFFEQGFVGARSVEDADIVCFTGGEDVDPSLYGQEPHRTTHFNPARDGRESQIYGEALALRKPMVGICRGAQFLNVMNGGKLWQDVNNHAIGGGHDILLTSTNTIYKEMTSTHHQQMVAAEDGEILGLACLSTKKSNDKEVLERDKPEMDDQEIVWYPDTLSLCFQPHPEFREGECRALFFDLLDDYIIPAC